MKRTPPTPLVAVTCEVCGKSSLKDAYSIKRNKHNYCSKDCFKNGQKKRIQLICATCHKQYERAPCYVGKREGCENHKTYCSNECRFIGKKGQSTWCKGIKIGPNEKIRGSGHGCWKNDRRRYPIQVTIRYCAYNEDWRKQVFIRDGFACTRCENIGRRLNAHHIIHFEKLFDEFMEIYDENRDIYEQIKAFDKFWSIANGLTLCEPCHKKVHARAKIV